MLHVRSQCCLMTVSEGISYMFACYRIIVIIRLLNQIIDTYGWRIICERLGSKVICNLVLKCTP